jgi:hypothetical protein
MISLLKQGMISSYDFLVKVRDDLELYFLVKAREKLRERNCITAHYNVNSKWVLSWQFLVSINIY